MLRARRGSRLCRGLGRPSREAEGAEYPPLRRSPAPGAASFGHGLWLCNVSRSQGVVSPRGSSGVSFFDRRSSSSGCPSGTCVAPVSRQAQGEYPPPPRTAFTHSPRVLAMVRRRVPGFGITRMVPSQSCRENMGHCGIVWLLRLCLGSED